MGGTSDRDAGQELREPFYGLLVSPDAEERDAIHRGIRTCSIRAGTYRYKEGEKLALFCDIAPWAVAAFITTVRHCRLDEISVEEFRDSGFEGLENFVETAREKFGPKYQNLAGSSPMTVIRWRDPRGYWVNFPDAYDAAEVALYHENASPEW